MIQLSNLPLPLGGDLNQLKKRAARLLGLHPSDIQTISLAKQSVDARKKQDVHYVCTVNVTVADEAKALAFCKQAKLVEAVPYAFPEVTRSSQLPPVVVGMGPAGLFSALFLARAGLKPIVLERGRPVEERTADVSKFWLTGQLNPQSNVQFGEGGAGTFSDGKLTTGTKDPRISAVLEALVEHGAPEDILWMQKPHIGTDVLRSVVKSVRQELLALGSDIRFGHQLTGLTHQGGQLVSIQVNHGDSRYDLDCDSLVLAPGHSARDTFRMLYEAGLPMEQKPFAVGVRMEHLQADISLAQYGESWSKLAPADYKLACHLANGRSAFSFCVCPGGEVVAAASEPGRLVTNGMSNRARDNKNINGGLLVGVQPSDFGSNHPLAGLDFQATWEEKAFQLGGGNFHAPAQTVQSFLNGTSPALSTNLTASYQPGVVAKDLSLCLPKFVTDSLRGALPMLGRKLKGFDHSQALMTGIETRSSSPVRIPRDASLQSSIRGLYPCGEGGGWAGGIMSAAVDGMKVAEQVAGS